MNYRTARKCSTQIHTHTNHVYIKLSPKTLPTKSERHVNRIPHTKLLNQIVIIISVNRRLIWLIHILYISLNGMPLILRGSTAGLITAVIASSLVQKRKELVCCYA